MYWFVFFQAEDGIRDIGVTGVQTCALPICQLTEAPITGIRIEYEGAVADMNTRALTSAAVTGVLRPFLQDINMVSAPVVARERGIMVEEVKRENAARDYESFIRIVVQARSEEHTSELQSRQY